MKFLCTVQLIFYLDLFLAAAALFALMTSGVALGVPAGTNTSSLPVVLLDCGVGEGASS